MQLTNRGLVVDFCLEDARKMQKRAQKLEKFAKIALQAKKDKRTEKRAEKREEETTLVDLGKKSQEKAKKKTLADINDVENLSKLKHESLSRGKK